MKKRTIKKFTRFSPRIRSRHPSHGVLRKRGKNFPLGTLPFKCVIRLGSTTTCPGMDVEINSIEAVQNSSSKRRMKECFFRDNVKTSNAFLANGGDWNRGNLFRNMKTNENVTMEELPYPIIIKPFNSSRGRGIVLVKDHTEMNDWHTRNIDRKNNYLFEQYYNFGREYRIHVTKNGCVYTNRKMLKSDAPEDKKFIRNDSNCVWYLETKEKFDKPANWNDIVNESVKALHAVGLDIGAVDVRTQTKKSSLDGTVDFVIIEINSAPSLGEGTAIIYKDVLPKLAEQKYNNR